jgi:hypothetical protein
MRRALVAFAAAGVAVTAPRLVLAFLAADGTTVPLSVHAQLQVVAAVAQALLLTGGGACLAAQAHATRSLLLGVAWTVSTFLTVLVIAPTAYAGVSAHLAEELPAPWLRWGYAAVLVLSVEVMAGGCLVAAGARRPQDQALPEAQPSSSGILGLGLAEALRVAPSPSPGAGQGLEEGLSLSETHGCPWCERTFSSAAARDGHKRHCPGRQAPQVPLTSAAEVRK